MALIAAHHAAGAEPGAFLYVMSAEDSLHDVMKPARKRETRNGPRKRRCGEMKVIVRAKTGRGCRWRRVGEFNFRSPPLPLAYLSL